MNENSISVGIEEVSIGDRFRVIREETSLIPVRLDCGETFEVSNIRTGFPEGPKIIIETPSGHTEPISPTSFAEALDCVDNNYSDEITVEHCIERV